MSRSPIPYNISLIPTWPPVTAMLLLGSKRSSSLSSMLRSSLGQHDVCAACVAAAKVHIQSNVRADADNHAAVRYVAAMSGVGHVTDLVFFRLYDCVENGGHASSALSISVASAITMTPLRSSCLLGANNR